MEITFQKDKYHLHKEIQSWCETNVGKGTWFLSEFENPDVKWLVSMMFGNQTYTFKDESDALFFILKWS